MTTPKNPQNKEARESDNAIFQLQRTGVEASREAALEAESKSSLRLALRLEGKPSRCVE